MTPNPVVSIGQVKFGNALPLAVIAGPCALESRAHALEVASALKEIAARVGIGLVYKSSFDKANRTSAAAGRGPRAPAAGQRDGDAAQGERKATPRSAGSGTRTQSRKAGPNAATAPRAPSKRTGSGRS